VTVDGSGNLYVADHWNHRIQKITPEGEVTTLAGSTKGFKDGTGEAVQFYFPESVAMDTSGNIYVADSFNNRIRKITPGGEVSTLAGDGTKTQLNNPYGVTVDSSSNVYVADCYHHCIRKITPEGEITTLAGDVCELGYKDGTGRAARFRTPTGVALDSFGNVYVADRGNHCIRKITPGGEVSTFAGGTEGYKDGALTAAQFNRPMGVAVDGSGNVYVADTYNQRIRKITPEGEVTTLAENMIRQFRYPAGVAVDGSGNVFVADTGNNRIRRITPGGW